MTVAVATLHGSGSTLVTRLLRARESGRCTADGERKPDAALEADTQAHHHAERRERLADALLLVAERHTALRVIAARHGLGRELALERADEGVG